jgi:cobalt/nickel transport system permease protein
LPLILPTQNHSSSTRSSFVEHTLVDVNHALEHSVFAEKTARLAGLLQSLDPRLKLASLILVLLAINLSHSAWVIAALYALALVLAALSAIPMGFFLKRVWILIPFFTSFVALPALFLTPGPPLVDLPWGWTITRPGAISMLLLLLRVGTSVSFAVLLILTTPWNNLLRALGVLGVPDVIILTLGMTYRYLHLFLHAADDMFTSRKSRILRRMTPAEDRRLLAAMSGALLGRSLNMSTEVYLAMLARGYRGYPRTIDSFSLRPVDGLAAALVLTISAAAIWLGR